MTSPDATAGAASSSSELKEVRVDIDESSSKSLHSVCQLVTFNGDENTYLSPV